MIIHILQMKNMVLREELCRQKAKHQEVVVMEEYALWNEMINTKKKLKDLLEKNKDLDTMYVNNRLEKYDELVQYYFILRTKQQMENYNVELNEWWELVETNLEEMQKNMVAHRKDEEACRIYLSTFKKVFPTFIYCNLDISKSSNII